MENQNPNQKTQQTRSNTPQKRNGDTNRAPRNGSSQDPNPFQKKGQQNRPPQKTRPPVKNTQPPKPKAQPNPPVPPKADPPISEEEELLLIEEDGDFFWVIQNIIWGIIKTIVILGGIGLLIWFIWGGSTSNLPNVELPSIDVQTPENANEKSLWERIFGDEEASNSTNENTTPNPSNQNQTQNQETPTPNTNQNTQPIVNPSQTVFISSNHAGIIAAQKNAILEENAFGSQNSLENGMLLLRKMDDIFKVPLASQLSAPTTQAREAKIDAFSRHIHDLIKKSVNMRNILTTEALQAEGRAQQYAQEARVSAQQITNAISYVQPQGIQDLLDRNIKIENETYTANAESDIRNAVVSKLQTYETALRSVSENITANREALILDIQVVKYENDPFGRVLTPAQWRSVQSQ